MPHFIVNGLDMLGGDIQYGKSANTLPEALTMAKEMIGSDTLRCATIIPHPK
jgi:hypothetical protein